MNKIIKTILLSAAILPAPLSPLVAQPSAKRVSITSSEYQETPFHTATVERKDDALRVAFDILVSEKMLTSKEALVVIPVLNNKNYSSSLPAVSFEGCYYKVVNAGKNNNEIGEPVVYLDRVAYKGAEIKYHYQVEVPYTPEMEGASLSLLEKTFCICENNNPQGGQGRTALLKPGSSDFAEAIKNDQTLYFQEVIVKAPEILSLKYNEGFGAASIFKSGQAAIVSTHTKDYNKVVKEINDLRSQQGVVINSVDVTVASSPEGSLKNNTILAEKRGKLMRDLLVKDLSVDTSQIHLTTIPENWDAFVTVVNNKPTMKNKERVLDIVKTEADLDAREATLNKLDNASEIMAIFHKLRTCIISINYISKDQAAGEFITLHPVVLGQDPQTDMAAAVKAYESTENNITASNLMVALMERGQNQEALAYAAKINDKEAGSVVLNNKAVVYGSNANIAAADTLFTKATGAESAAYNHGVSLLLNRQYEAAAAQLKPYHTGNAIIASIKGGQYAQAVAQCDAAEATGEVHYLRAVAYAGMEAYSKSLNSLQAACEADASLKAKARTQPEFARMYSNTKFVAITK